MKLLRGDSSMVHALGYDEEAQELEVVFTSGSIWRYRGVPKEVYEELLASDSIGGYMRDLVIGVYPDDKLSRGRR